MSSCPIKNRTDGPLKCTWTPGAPLSSSPHHHVESKPEPKICSTVLDHIGNTPLVRINKIGKSEGLKCELLAKCEFFNAGGSVKDRIGARMVEEAEKSGRLKKGDTLIEPTSGNTGIGLALAAAVKGYRCIITMPEKMSQEKVDVLRGLGAEIIRTPTEAAFDAPDSHISVALRLNKEIPNSHILDQYANPYNPIAHYDTTAEEILNQCDGKIDMVVIGAGTGGTIAGIARKLKERVPNCKVIGVDPHGSILAEPAELNANPVSSYIVEGIGYDFVPTVLDRNYVDKWYKSSDKESLLMARRLIKEEGILCGGSSGTAMHAAMDAAKELKEGQRCVVILPDSVRNYMTKFLNEDYMISNGFIEASTAYPSGSEWWHSKTAADFIAGTTCSFVSKPPTTTCQEASKSLTSSNSDQLAIVDTDGSLKGFVTAGSILSKIASKRAMPSDPVSKAYFAHRQLSESAKLDQISRVLERDSFVAIVEKSTPSSPAKLITVITRAAFLNYISASQA